MLANEPLDLGRYELFDELASGGMATVHLSRQRGAVGFMRTVAIKRLHERCSRDPVFVAMFLDEARLAARIRHPNVVPTLDVVKRDRDLFIVMEYVHGDSLSRLALAAELHDEQVPLPIVSAVMGDTLRGLHAAHEATTESGQPLRIVHRDVSPQNIMVGTDGVARVVDFGVAKAASRAQWTDDGQLKGKLAYMAPEQIRQAPVDRRCDIFSAGVVLWELLTGARLIDAQDHAGKLAQILELRPRRPSELVPTLPAAVDALVLRALASDPLERFASAADFAVALQSVLPPASPAEVGAWVERLAFDSLDLRARQLRAMELATPGNPRATSDLSPTPLVIDSWRPTDPVGPRSSLAYWRLFAAAAATTVAASALTVGVLALSRESRAGGAPETSIGRPLVAVPGVSVASALASAPSAQPALTEGTTGSAATTAASVTSPAARTAPRQAVLRTTRPPVANPCDPPFRLVDGLRRYKPECLR